MRRSLSLILALILCLSLLPMGALAEEAVDEPVPEDAIVEAEPVEIVGEVEETAAPDDTPAGADVNEDAGNTVELDDASSLAATTETTELMAESEESVVSDETMDSVEFGAAENETFIEDDSAMRSELPLVESEFELMLDGVNLETAFLWPVSNKRINALDHYSNGSQHGGIDINASSGSSVWAIASGTVVRVGNGCSHKSAGVNHNCYSSDGWGSYGNYVVLQHSINGTTYTSVYAHLTQNSLTVKVGDTVTAGQVIGKSGSSGSASGAHLHLEIYEGKFRGSIKTLRSQSFQYYQNNTGVLTGMTFSGHVSTSSTYFGSWVQKNCEKQSGNWKYTGGSNSIKKPSAPTITSVSAVSSSALKVQWNSVSGATSYRIEWRPAGDGIDYETIATGVTGTSYTHTGLKADTRYWYRVYAVNSAGTSEKSDSVDGRTASADVLTLKYNANGASGSMSNITATYGNTFTVPACGFTYSGYTFQGWTVKRNGDGKWHVAGHGWLTESEISKGGYTKELYTVGRTPTIDDSWTNGYSGSDKSYTLYAVWEINVLTKKFNVNGGSISSGTYSVSSSGTVQRNSADLEDKWDYGYVHPYGLYDADTFGMYRTGYTFVGWSLSKDGSSTVWAQDDATATSEKIYPNLKNGSATVTLYAIWKAETAYTVYFDYESDTLLETQTYSLGDDWVVSSKIPAKAGYKFLGWHLYNYVRADRTFTEDVNTSDTVDFLPGQTVSGSEIYITYVLTAVWQKDETPPAGDAPVFTVSDASASPGSDVTVTVSVKNNPGIGGIICGVTYDKTVLELKSAAGLIADGTWDIDDIAENDIISWADYTGKIIYEGDGNILTLTFRIKDGTQQGDTTVNLSFGDMDAVSDGNGDEIANFVLSAGTIRIQNYLSGDINGDGRVNVADVVRLAQYIKSRGNGVSAVTQALDTNGDGRTNVADVVRLAQYIKARGVGVEIH